MGCCASSTPGVGRASSRIAPDQLLGSGSADASLGHYSPVLDSVKCAVISVGPSINDVTINMHKLTKDKTSSVDEAASESLAFISKRRVRGNLLSLATIEQQAPARVAAACAGSRFVCLVADIISFEGQVLVRSLFPQPWLHASSPILVLLVPTSGTNSGGTHPFMCGASYSILGAMWTLGGHVGETLLNKQTKLASSDATVVFFPRHEWYAQQDPMSTFLPDLLEETSVMETRPPAIFCKQPQENFSEFLDNAFAQLVGAEFDQHDPYAYLAGVGGEMEGQFLRELRQAQQNLTALWRSKWKQAKGASSWNHKQFLKDDSAASVVASLPDVDSAVWSDRQLLVSCIGVRAGRICESLKVALEASEPQNRRANVEILPEDNIDELEGNVQWQTGLADALIVVDSSQQGAVEAVTDFLRRRSDKGQQFTEGTFVGAAIILPSPSAAREDWSRAAYLVAIESELGNFAILMDGRPSINDPHIIQSNFLANIILCPSAIFASLPRKSSLRWSGVHNSSAMLNILKNTSFITDC